MTTREAPPIWAELGYARVARWLWAALPAEGCAVGLGADGRVSAWVHIPNVDPRPDHFEMASSALAAALVRGRRAGLEPTVFLHSHVGGRAEPSARDRAALRHRGDPWWPRTWILIQVVTRRGLGPRALWPPGAPGDDRRAG